MDITWIDPMQRTIHAPIYLPTNIITKTFHPSEPMSNVDGFPLPPWFNADQFYEALESEYGADAATLIGDRSVPVAAKYFVVHDTSGGKEPNTANIDKNDDMRGIHLYLGTATTVFRASKSPGKPNDWNVKGWGTLVGNKRAEAFVHVELSPLTRYGDGIWKTEAYRQFVAQEISGSKRAGSIYTERQYRLLAAAYLICSIRAGRLLTVTLHREVDRGANENAHSDPRDFDLDYFYSIIAEYLGLNDVTFGIEQERAMFRNQMNITGHPNAFMPFVTHEVESANQYGPVK
jgi:hypothetical protein